MGNGCGQGSFAAITAGNTPTPSRKKRAGLHGYRVTYQNAANGQEKIKSYEHKVPKKGKHATSSKGFAPWQATAKTK